MLTTSPRHHGRGVRQAALRHCIVDYLITEGFADAAHAFQHETSPPHSRVGGGGGGDLSDDMSARMAIRKLIEAGDIAAAIDRINEYAPECLERDEHCGLLFHLRIQEAVELIRRGHGAVAMRFAKDFIAENAENDAAMLAAVEETAITLAFTSETALANSKLSFLHRQTLVAAVNAALLNTTAQTNRTHSDMTALCAATLFAQTFLRSTTSSALRSAIIAPSNFTQQRMPQHSARSQSIAQNQTSNTRIPTRRQSIM